MSFKWSSGTTDARHFLSSLRVNRKRRQTNNPRFLNTSAEHLNILKKHDYVPEPYNSRIPISVYQKKEIHHFNLRKDLNWSIVFIIPRSFVFFFSYNIWKLFLCSSHSFGIPWNIAAIPVNSRKRSNIPNDSNSKKTCSDFKKSIQSMFWFFSSKKEEGIENINSIYLFLPWLTYFIWYFFCCCIFPKMLISFRNWFFTHKIEIWNLLEDKHISMDLFSDNFHRRRIWHYIYILM